MAMDGNADEQAWQIEYWQTLAESAMASCARLRDEKKEALARVSQLRRAVDQLALVVQNFRTMGGDDMEGHLIVSWELVDDIINAEIALNQLEVRGG